MRPEFGPFLSACLLLVAMLIASTHGVTVCSCGSGSCNPAQCRDYPLDQCVQNLDLCTGEPTDPATYVTVTQSDSNYVGSFYSDSQCQTTATASFSAPCGVCNMGLHVQVKCSGGSSAAALNSWLDAVSGLSL